MYNEVIKLVHQTRDFILNEDVSEKYITKGKADFVTEVDLAVQSFLKEELLKLYPDYQFMGEEGDHTSMDLTIPTWILDPIDGTTNLIHEYRQSAVSLGLVINSEAVFGIVYNPFTNESFTAEKGKGAFLWDKPISVSQAETMEESLITIGTSPYYKYLAEKNFEIFRQIFMECQDIRRSGSASIDLCYIAAGRIDGYFEHRLKPWDYAAGSIILQEAGGKITTIDNKEIVFDTEQDILASNGKIHRQMLKYFTI